MTATTWTERLETMVGPIVVKEVRQGLRARVFAIFFGLLLTGCVVVAIIAAARAGEAQSGRLGKEFFATYLIAQGFVCYFVIPYTAFRSLLREREDETWVLLVLTGLGARNIVRGKFSSAMSQALLFGSACAPFVVFSYYLNGIDIIQVGLGLAMSAAWTILLVAVALGVATQAESRLGRAAAHFFVLALLAGATGLGFAFSVILADEGGQAINEVGFLVFCGGIAVGSVAIAAVVLEGAAAGLSLITEPASRGPRIALTLLLLAAWLFGAVGTWLGNPERDLAVVGSVITSLLLVVAGVFAVSEHDGWTRATRRYGWLRPGAMRSWRLVVALLAGSTVVWVVLFEGMMSTGSDKRLYALFAAPLYVVTYVSAGAFLGRVTALARFGEPLASRLGFAIVTTLGVVVPPLVAVLRGSSGSDRGSNYLNPVVGMVNFVERLSRSEARTALTLLGASALLAVFLAWVSLSSRDKEHSI